MSKVHNFHIPIMGIGFTIDTPIKVAHLGIDSVISLVDDILIEKMRQMYSQKYQFPYTAITEKHNDYRAKRITSYLNTIHDLANQKFQDLKNYSDKKQSEFKDYISLLPNSSDLRREFNRLLKSGFSLSDISKQIQSKMSMGNIDVNIMTKVDKENYKNGEKLPSIYNDAHAALRGFANSKLNSSIILSAGLNPRLYSYISEFDDFFPNKSGEIKKKIVLKVSDFRSALIQGKFLAKKGVWVSEYRIESGLNCGGHSFVKEAALLGPVLQEFKDKRSDLIESNYHLFKKALIEMNREIPDNIPALKYTAQGGVGTAEEHQFLIDYYNLDSVGWGSPFLLVPDVVNVDDYTLNELEKAKEEDLFLSNMSPLGVPFNSLRNNSKSIENQKYIDQGKPGSPCPKKYVELYNTEFTKKPICVASRRYQFNKIKELDNKNLDSENYKTEFDKITEKACICVGLGTPALLINNIETDIEGSGVSVCPGPNMAYFSKVVKLKEMVDHIYGRVNIIKRKDRPNIFVKELNLYVNYLKNKYNDAIKASDYSEFNQISRFANDLLKGVDYYKDTFSKLKESFVNSKQDILNELDNNVGKILAIKMKTQKVAKQ